MTNFATIFGREHRRAEFRTADATFRAVEWFPTKPHGGWIDPDYFDRQVATRRADFARIVGANIIVTTHGARGAAFIEIGEGVGA